MDNKRGTTLKIIEKLLLRNKQYRELKQFEVFESEELGAEKTRKESKLGGRNNTILGGSIEFVLVVSIKRQGRIQAEKWFE